MIGADLNNSSPVDVAYARALQLRIEQINASGKLGDRQLLLLGDDALARALTRFTPAGMDSAVRDSRELLAMPSPEIAAMVRQDPLGLFGLLREQLGDAGGDRAGRVAGGVRAR